MGTVPVVHVPVHDGHVHDAPKRARRYLGYLPWCPLCPLCPPGE